eukprot:m.266113 g.266113  ORF g.266113 m.266113 type:complete len:130 (+) comp40498_c1_seq1:44-433(+)
MVFRCIAFGCESTAEKGFALFRFPKDAKRRKKWTDQVKRARARWSGPTDSSRVCEVHFESSCFESAENLNRDLGCTPRKKRLTAEAIPAVFKQPGEDVKTVPAKRTAYEKRERARVIASLLDDDPDDPY